MTCWKGKRIRRTIGAGATVALLAALVGFAPPPAVHGSVSSASFQSDALGAQLSFLVYTPARYELEPNRRFPVVYFLHGLPADESAFLSQAIITPAFDRLRAQAIVVFPQAATAADPDAEYHDWGPGRNWETAISSELPAYVDANYRTIADRRGRALVGISAGGYGAMTIGLHHLDRYAAIESWSGYFHPTVPDGTAPMELGSPDADRYADLHQLVPQLPQLLAQWPTFLGFYVGSGDLFAAENAVFARELSHAHVKHLYARYRGGHDNDIWLAHARSWVALALARLAPPTVSGEAR